MCFFVRVRARVCVRDARSEIHVVQVKKRETEMEKRRSRKWTRGYKVAAVQSSFGQYLFGADFKGGALVDKDLVWNEHPRVEVMSCSRFAKKIALSHL